ncbi:MAG TPA: phage tail sheath subtilisin-like domain-containing protein [Kribbellaceae bacterium]
MATTYKTPGVFIEELPATGPIAGVGTSTAAFLGPAARGPILTPTKVTNWTQFRETFGDYLGPTQYLAYAVRGFFDNGGTIAYITRVATAVRAWVELDDDGAAGGKALRVEARAEGTTGNSITVAVTHTSIVSTAVVRKARAQVDNGAGTSIKLTMPADAAKFTAGDRVIIEGTTDESQVDRVRGGELILTTPLTGTYNAAAAKFVRISDLKAGQTSFRVRGGASLERGSVVHLAQALTTPTPTTVGEDAVVDTVTGEIVTLKAPLANGYLLGDTDPDATVKSLEFTLTFAAPGAATETFSNLSMDPRHSRFFPRVINSALVTVRLPASPSVQPPPKNRPKPTTVGTPTPLANGQPDNILTINLTHYQAALAALEKVDDVNLICVPDRRDTPAQQAVVAHCEKMGDRFAILDPALNEPPLNETVPGGGTVITHRAAVESARGYAALYYPWLRVVDPASPTGEDTLLVPPSGHLAGIYARSDDQRGVHKAPANEYVTAAVDLEVRLSGEEQGELNVENVNALRVFAGQARPLVWGARTTAPPAETPWRYVNIRRLFLFVEESIQEGIRWAVFEPNDLALWKKLDRTIREFLTRVWRSGALFGATADEAFYIKIDEELNPAAVRALGQVVIEIGMAPVRPAEFVIVRIGIWDGGSSVSEG